jgi:hypothetical protein
MTSDDDHGLDTLLALDGVTYFVDQEGTYRVRFVVQRVGATAERPHGLNYSLTLHDRAGERLVGFDNAHPVSAGRRPSRRARTAHDHRHRHRTIRPYDYKDAATLLADIWEQVDAVLKEKGVLR